MPRLATASASSSPTGRRRQAPGAVPYGAGMSEELDPACVAAHTEAATPTPRTLLVVFASPVARALMRHGRDLGFTTVLLEPVWDRMTFNDRAHADVIRTAPGGEYPDDNTDVVVTDHHREELPGLLRTLLDSPFRWLGVMGNARHVPAWVDQLRTLGVDEASIKRIHRPIGLDIGSRTPPEIAIATLAGLIADRNGRSGGFFPPGPLS